MLALKNVAAKPVPVLVEPPAGNAEERKQRRMMAVALVLLLLSLGVVLFRDRDFWFPDTEQTEELRPPEPAAHSTVSTAASNVVAQPVSTTAKKESGAKAQPKIAAPAKSVDADASAPPFASITNRTVLPPLEVEVVAGDVHKTVHPGTNSVRVDLQSGSAPQKVVVPSASNTANASVARVNSNAAAHVQMSTDTVQVVSQPVKPSYPLLARQMKVEGSVILQALIGRDGLIQDLHVVSGPPILASAAEEAVKQWHFKPHYQGADPVETQARITVNFTISTN
jgi:TonB family protein